MSDVHLHEREFEIRFLKSRGIAFQDLFSDVMERAFPADFQRVRPHGNTGDLKCDGYRRSDRAVFQTYGPDEVRNLGRLLTKITDDLTGALAQWHGLMDTWIFVHNSQSGLPAQAVQRFEELRAQEGAPKIAVWSFAEVLQLVRRLSPADLQGLFPIPARQIGLEHRRFPSVEAARTYWRWVAAVSSSETRSSVSASLQGLELPIRLVLPQDEEARRVEEEREERTGYHDDGGIVPPAAPNRRAGKVQEFDLDTIHRLLRDHPRLLVLGDSGSGKTTLLRSIAVAEAKRLLHRGPRSKSRRTPILVELWRFSGERSVLDLILAAVAEGSPVVSADEVNAAMKAGFVLILLDGVDEVPVNLRRECLAQIVTLSQQCSRSRFVVTSRVVSGLPAQFHTLVLAALRDEDIATAIATLFPSKRAFRERFDGMGPSDYVRLKLRPAVRQLCRRPLTLALVLSAISAKRGLPETLFRAYELFIAWALGWEHQTERLRSSSAAMVVLQETAYDATRSNLAGLTLAKWTAVAGHALQRLLVEHGTTVSVEDLLAALTSTGLIRVVGGDVRFSHRSLQEFFAAKRLIECGEIDEDRVALQPGVAQFLCGALDDVELLLERHLDECSDVAALMPFLMEANRAGARGGKFEDLYRAIALGQELGVEINYGMRGPRAETFLEEVTDLVNTCVGVGPKTISVLKDAAYGVVAGTPWDQSRSWFECLVDGLDRLRWPGTRFHRKLVQLGFFELVEHFSDDGTDEDDGWRSEHLFDFLRAMHDEDWEVVAERLRDIEELLKNVNREPPEI